MVDTCDFAQDFDEASFCTNVYLQCLCSPARGTLFTPVQDFVYVPPCNISPNDDFNFDLVTLMFQVQPRSKKGSFNFFVPILLCLHLFQGLLKAFKVVFRIIIYDDVYHGAER